jgi:NRPS condensation-like uncharacterized protein
MTTRARDSRPRSVVAGMPFSVVDELACYFDRPGEPNNVHLELAVAGRLDSDRLRAAVAATLDTHEAARIRRARWRWYHRGFRWEVSSTPDVDPLTVADGDLAVQRRSFLATAPSLESSPPLRLRLVRQHGAEEVLMLNAHHAALDGPSCLHLLTAVARHYAGVADPRPTADRATVRALTSGSATTPWTRWIGPGLVGRPARIATDGGRPAAGCGICTITVEAPVARHGHTVNDLLVAAMSRTVARWNDRHGRPAGTIRVTVPVNGRPPERRTEPLGNLCRLSTVVTTAVDRADPHRLVARVATQNPRVEWSGGSPVGAMAWTLGNRWLPVAFKALLTSAATRLGGHLIDTVLLSNLGRLTDVPHFGDAGPAVAAHFSGPAPMPRGLSLCAVTVDERLHLCFRYRYALLDDDAAGRFAVAYVQSLHDLLEAVGDGRSGR